MKTDMPIENCAATFPNKELVKRVDPASSFTGNREDPCDVTDENLRRICISAETEDSFRSVAGTNREIGSILGDKVKTLVVEQYEDTLFVNVPMEAIGAGAIRDDYPGTGRGAKLVELINRFTQDSPHMRELVCHCWGVDPEGDIPFIYIPFGNRV